ncbi:Conserved oligomeric Golgi complex subunit 2 [Phlyctochytrium planicorne]|nr:Conserved oligomeric Golgi complex subunit 2 [Phlyctochytrium planicorne]
MEFADDDFSAETYLSNRLSIPIPRLKTDLAAKLSSLKNELVELINRDYADFISLSTNLVGADKMIGEINRPLTRIKANVTDVRSYLEDLMGALKEKLELRAEIREKKTYLQLYLNISESVEKVETLLNIKQTFPPTPNSEKADGNRVAIEYNQLQFLVSRGLKTPFVENIEWRITRIKETLIATLSQSLRESYCSVAADPSDSGAAILLAQYLKTCVLIDKTKEAGAVFEESIVMPFLASAFPQNQAIDTSNTGYLKDLHAKILKFIRERCSKILDICEATLKDTSYDLFTDAIFVNVITASKEIVGVMEEGLGKKVSKSGTRNTLELGSHVALTDALNRCWDDDVFDGDNSHFNNLWKALSDIVQAKSENYHRRLAYFESLAGLMSLIPTVRTLLADSLARKSAKFLEEKIAEIVPKYRFASQLPDQPSDFVAAILSPVKTLLVDPEKSLPAEDLKQLKIDVSTLLIQRYGMASSRMLQEAEESEKYIRNRKKQKGGVSTDLLASEKVRLQLKIDIISLEQELKLFGVSPVELAGLQDLKNQFEGTKE